MVNKAKTATEAEIMAQGLQSRVAERQDVVEDWISEMSQYSAELCLQEMTLQEVQGIAGMDAVWPQMNKEQIFRLVQIEIRAGSAGRPNKAKEREQWGQMLPQIQQSVTQIMQLREAGQNDMAETMMKLMEETLRRFDERIDIESFLPQKEEGEQAPTIPPELQQQMQQAQEMMQQLQEENAKLKQIADGKQADLALQQERLAFDREKANAELATELNRTEKESAIRLEEARIKAEMDAQAKIEAERIRAELERENIASQERIELAKSMMNVAGQQQQQAVVGEQMQAEQANTEAMAQMAEMLQVMQQAIGQMGSQFAQAIGGLQSQLTAPKRVIRDAEGNMVGVETIQ